MKKDADELELVMARLRAEHDVLPFMQQVFASGEMSLRLLPAEMEAVLLRSGDFQTPAPGSGPVWLQVSTNDDEADLVVYRTLSGTLYVAAPLSSS
ncbi:hypothetical protein VVT58_16040 (plasmid) [Sphingobium sp. SJ10-10]|uniref:hypothetical protein n=1 Tax=Sphingobium sp. SJ10-10 TaxID=3114999 RepID=UPI002E18244F|nr:hypothetical protein [Sphingobium sp. SJ10-10]